MARDEKNAGEKNLLAVDVGNTTTRLGLFAAGELVGTWELTTRERLTADEARMQLAQALPMMGEVVPGAAILACGAKGKRLALPNSMVLIHQPSSGVQGQQTDIQIVADETRWIRQRLNEILSEATGQPIEKINADTERDNYMRAAEACAYGLVDKVISSRVEQSQE